ncbi:M20 family metallopeptidase [Actinomadura vinacea]|uniref:M20 family metallopeptidase n=1 Tax=Actinomadura vinacea TaxID=115336 RepID=A0ABN3I9T4_9ACTN
MSLPEKHHLTRRALLGGTAAVGAGALLASAAPAIADAVPGSGSVDQKSVDAVAARLDRHLVALRRDIHRHPETAGEEGRTAAMVAGRLRSAGLTVTTGVGGHGVVGVLDGARPGRTVAYRADMDAVPPGDQIEGAGKAAHLCGHDLHTTVGVGVAQVLARLRHRLSGRLVFLFQPAEEALTGARAMLADGVLEWTRPQEIHALHCGPFPVGQFAVTPGTGLPGQDRSVVTLQGPDAAEQARRLAAAIAELNTVALPVTSADFEWLVQNLQKPNGPLARSIAIRARAGEADAEGKAKVEVSYRCWPEERYVEVRDKLRGLAEPYAGSQVSFPAEPFPAMVCPEQEGRALERHLRRVLGPDAVTVLHAAIPFSGEDYALFLDRIPGTFTFLGVRAPGADITTCYPHLGGFDPDERAIGIGVRAMAGWLAKRLG